MNVKELEQQIAKLRQEGKIGDRTDVFINQYADEYANAPAEMAEAREIQFKADDEDPDPARVVCLVLSDQR